MPPVTFNGIVTKAGFMNKTVTVTVSRWVIHKLTGKRIERSKKHLVHDENNQLRKDDVVVIRHCLPVSRTKKFTLDTILKSPETEHDLARALRAQQSQKSTSGVQQGSAGPKHDLSLGSHKFLARDEDAGRQ